MEKEVFERLLMEFNENNDRANKLRDFILNDDKFQELDNLNKDLLIAQLKAMEAYISVLSIRIGLNSQMAQNAPDTEDNAIIIEETTNTDDTQSND
jgi:hypothetical protein